MNPNAIEARFLAVDFAIQAYNFELARQQLDEIKARNDSALADAYEGRLLLKELLPEQAIAPLKLALEKNPQLARRDGWLAGAYYILADEPHMREQLAAMQTSGGTHNPAALFECAEILRDDRQFTEAEKLYADATSNASWWSEPIAPRSRSCIWKRATKRKPRRRTTKASPSIPITCGRTTSSCCSITCRNFPPSKARAD